MSQQTVEQRPSQPAHLSLLQTLFHRHEKPIDPGEVFALEAKIAHAEATIGQDFASGKRLWIDMEYQTDRPNVSLDDRLAATTLAMERVITSPNHEMYRLWKGQWKGQKLDLYRDGFERWDIPLSRAGDPVVVDIIGRILDTNEVSAEVATRALVHRLMTTLCLPKTRDEYDADIHEAFDKKDSSDIRVELIPGRLTMRVDIHHDTQRKRNPLEGFYTIRLKIADADGVFAQRKSREEREERVNGWVTHLQEEKISTLLRTRDPFVKNTDLITIHEYFCDPREVTEALKRVGGYTKVRGKTEYVYMKTGNRIRITPVQTPSETEVYAAYIVESQEFRAARETRLASDCLDAVTLSLGKRVGDALQVSEGRRKDPLLLSIEYIPRKKTELEGLVEVVTKDVGTDRFPFEMIERFVQERFTIPEEVIAEMDRMRNEQRWTDVTMVAKGMMYTMRPTAWAWDRECEQYDASYELYLGVERPL